MRARVYVRVYVCLFVRVYKVCVCVCVCLLVRVHVYLRACVYLCAYLCVCQHTQVCLKVLFFLLQSNLSVYKQVLSGAEEFRKTDPTVLSGDMAHHIHKVVKEK